jgi:hypothetical protein
MFCYHRSFRIKSVFNGAAEEFQSPDQKVDFYCCIGVFFISSQTSGPRPPKCSQADPKICAEPFWNKVLKFFDLSCLVKKVILRIYSQTFWSGCFELPRALVGQLQTAGQLRTAARAGRRSATKRLRAPN